LFRAQSTKICDLALTRTQTQRLILTEGGRRRSCPGRSRIGGAKEPRQNYFITKVKASPYSITERRVPELIPVLGSQPAGDVSHKPDGRLPLLSARPAVTPATLKRAATNFAAW